MNKLETLALHSIKIIIPFHSRPRVLLVYQTYLIGKLERFFKNECEY